MILQNLKLQTFIKKKNDVYKLLMFLIYSESNLE